MVVDRRHVGNSSPRAEHAGLHRALYDLHKAGVHVSEVVTDENSAVTADFSKLPVIDARIYAFDE